MACWNITVRPGLSLRCLLLLEGMLLEPSCLVQMGISLPGRLAAYWNLTGPREPWSGRLSLLETVSWLGPRAWCSDRMGISLWPTLELTMCWSTTGTPGRSWEPSCRAEVAACQNLMELSS